jgi:phosphoglycolate phosphatase
MRTKIKAVGFDFDGTLISSEDKKSIEMAKVFKEKFGIKRGVKTAYEKLIGTGKNRHEKVESLFAQFIKRKPTKKELKEVENHFGKHYEKSLSTCPLFECTNVITELKKQVKFLFLLSLENKKEVKRVLKHCGLEKYFNEVLGGPETKVNNLSGIIKKQKLKPSEIIYIGDSHSDVIASKKLGMKVVLLGKKHTYLRLKEDLEADFVFSNLCDLPHKISDLN